MKFLIITLSFLFITSCAHSPEKKIEKRNSKEDKINSCICMEIYAPVCGNNGITYANSCLAKCEKISYRDGECR